jgi:hypothetical protein
LREESNILCRKQWYAIAISPVAVLKLRWQGVLAVFRLNECFRLLAGAQFLRATGSYVSHRSDDVFIVNGGSPASTAIAGAGSGYMFVVHDAPPMAIIHGPAQGGKVNSQPKDEMAMPSI